MKRRARWIRPSAALTLVTVAVAAWVVTAAALSVEAAPVDRTSRAVVAYLAARPGDALEPGASGSSVRAAPARQASGNATLGKDYFSGVQPFRNGGPSCMACHSVAGLPALGGGAVGPDLTGAVAKYAGATNLLTIMGGAVLPFPTMRPIFSAHPLTPEERADVVAFLAEAPLQTRSPDALLPLAGLGALGGLLIAGLFQIVWRKRLAAVRKPLVGGVR